MRAAKLDYVGTYKNSLKIPRTDRFDCEFSHTFFWEFEGHIEDFDPNEEVGQIKFFSLEAIAADFHSDNPQRKYSPYGSYFDLVVDKIGARLERN